MESTKGRGCEEDLCFVDTPKSNVAAEMSHHTSEMTNVAKDGSVSSDTDVAVAASASFKSKSTDTLNQGGVIAAGDSSATTKAALKSKAKANPRAVAPIMAEDMEGEDIEMGLTIADKRAPESAKAQASGGPTSGSDLPKSGKAKRFAELLGGPIAEDADRDDPDPVLFQMVSLRDLYRFEENTYWHIGFGVFLMTFQTFCLLLAISDIEVEEPDLKMQFVGLPISLVLMFGSSWEEFQLQMGLMLLNIKHSNDLKDDKRDLTICQRYLNFHALQAVMASGEVLIVLFTVAASVLVTIQKRTVLDIALECTALSLIAQLDECLLVMFRLRLSIVQPQKRIEAMEEKAEEQFDRIGAYKFRVFVVAFYCTVYFFFALFNNNYYYTNKYPWQQFDW